jgi:hypothetical protein
MSIETLKNIIISLYLIIIIVIILKIIILFYKLYKLKNKNTETMLCGQCGKECELLIHKHNDRTDLWCYCDDCRINTFHESMQNLPKINKNSLERQN